jgi:hypothetical protein
MIDAVRGRSLALAVLGIGLIGSQAGHLLAFQIRFGDAARHLQSSGAHAYFPLVAKTTLGAVAVTFLTALFIIGLARVLRGGSGIRTRTGPRYIELLAALFTIQLAAFITQEVGEALISGVPVDSAAHLLLWGTLGQLPVAVLAAIALGWLWTRFESAVQDLRAVLVIAPFNRASGALARAVSPASNGALLLAQLAGGSLGKRGPPTSSRVSS